MSDAQTLMCVGPTSAPLRPLRCLDVDTDANATAPQVAFINTAINLPAQSFYQLLPSLLPILASYRRVIFHCQTSNGRGTRAAMWYQDALDERRIGHEVSRSEILQGGIVRWVEVYGDEADMTTRLATSSTSA